MAALKPTDDPYRILGILRGADLDQVKAAHRKLAKRFHPDGTTGDEQRFLAVQEAYQLLSDPGRRRDWDRRHSATPSRATAPASPASPESRRAAPRGSGAQGVASSRRGTTRAARPSRGPGQRTTTWSAEHVPWWEDFSPSGRRSNGEGASAPDGPSSTAPGSRPQDASAGPEDGRQQPAPSIDFDVFSRSSGAAWSMAARRHFRRGESDLPSRGAWRYRGTQVVTGAEARKVAAEEAAAQAAAQAEEDADR